MRFIKLMMAAIIAALIFPSFSTAAQNYIGVTNKSGQTVLLKQNPTSQSTVQLQPLTGSCVTFSSSASGGYLAGSSYDVIYTYTTSCAGYHVGDNFSYYPVSSDAYLVLQEYSGGSWTQVAGSFSGYSYYGGAGEYRIVVENLGTNTITSFSLDYQLPL